MNRRITSPGPLKGVLMTERTVLLPATANDLQTVSALWNDSGVRHQLFQGEAVGLAHARRLLDAGLAAADTGLSWWLVYPWAAGPALGCVGLLRSQVPPLAFCEPVEAVEMLIAFGPEAWAQGYPQDATTELVSHAVHSLCLPRLGVLAGVADPMFDGLLRRLGFKFRTAADTGSGRPHLHELDAVAARRAWVEGAAAPAPQPVASVQDPRHPATARGPA